MCQDLDDELWIEGQQMRLGGFLLGFSLKLLLLAIRLFGTKRKSLCVVDQDLVIRVVVRSGGLHYVVSGCSLTRTGERKGCGHQSLIRLQ